MSAVDDVTETNMNISENILWFWMLQSVFYWDTYTLVKGTCVTDRKTYIFIYTTIRYYSKTN